MSPQRTRRSLSPHSVCIGVSCRNSGPAHMGGEPREFVISNLPFHTHQHNRVFHLSTLAAASIIRKRLTGGDTGRGVVRVRGGLEGA